MKDYVEKHVATGFMTNVPPAARPADTDPFASTVVCDRPACRQAAQEWVAAFYPYFR